MGRAIWTTDEPVERRRLSPHHIPQAATAASMADSFNSTPGEGDGFTYEMYDEREEVRHVTV